MRSIVVFVAALLSAFSLQAATDARPPEQAASAFYGWVLASRSVGLPTPKQRTQLANMLAPELIDLLKRASETEARCVRNTPKGDKPNIIESALFVGNYESASEVAYGPVRRDGDVVHVGANLVYIDPRFAKAHPHRVAAWKDSLDLRLAGNRWWVQDIQFQQDQSLSSVLKAYIAEGAQSCGKR